MRRDCENWRRAHAGGEPLSGPKICDRDSAERRRLWQRYTYFRPWYADARVLDLSPWPGGPNFVGVTAAGILAPNAPHAAVHPEAVTPPLEATDGETLSRAELVLDLADSHFVKRWDHWPPLIERGTDWIATIDLERGRIEDVGLGWVRMLESVGGIQWFSQAKEPPYSIRPGRSADACAWIAARNSKPPPHWPSVAVAVPTRYAGKDLSRTCESLLTYYPGRLELAIVANGCEAEEWRTIEPLLDLAPGRTSVVTLPENRGFAEGANAGLEALSRGTSSDLYAVCNDDVELAPDCLTEMCEAFLELRALGHRPGAIGPISNEVHGPQRIEMPTDSFEDKWDYVHWLRRQHHHSVRQTVQLRGLLLALSADCLESVGGFDPRFEIGNYEDDDHNVRTRLAGFTLWIAEGAYVHHRGSRTFKKLDLDYDDLSRRNLRRFLQKWNVTGYEQAFLIDSCPAGVRLYEPLGPSDAQPDYEGANLGMARSRSRIMSSGCSSPQ
jgi:GT2 family glycosyltransferase